ncbi:MAG: hypothetical protein GY718_10735, partial [Lentisphaerae bacterium]|nr:hypothetical protein [Lentisphaerota bacterium]
PFPMYALIDLAFFLPWLYMVEFKPVCRTIRQVTLDATLAKLVVVDYGLVSFKSVFITTDSYAPFFNFKSSNASSSLP